MTNNYYQQRLKEEFARRLEKNARYSLRAYARDLHVDAGALSRILAGDRTPTLKVATSLVEGLGLEPNERARFFESLAKTNAPSKIHTDLSQESFRVIADWFHAAILELIQTEDFRPETRWIAKKLGISTLQTKHAIERLVDLDLIEETAEGYQRKTQRLHLEDPHLTHTALKKRQKQVMAISENALENIDIQKRNHSAMTMAIDPDRIPEAKQRIQEFLDELCSELSSGRRKEVYECTVQLFPLKQN